MRHPPTPATAAAILAATAFAALAGGPAQAEDPPRLTIEATPEIVLAVGGEAVAQRLGFSIETDAEQYTLTDVTYVFDLAAIADIATVIDKTGGDLGCATEGTTMTCGGEGNDVLLIDGRTSFTPFALQALPGAAEGAAGDLPVTVSASNALTAAPAVTSVLAARPADLAVTGPGDLPRTAQVGETVSVPSGVRNAGDTEAEGAVLVYYGAMGLRTRLGESFENCEANAQVAICRFDTVMGPGEAYSLSRELQWRVRDDAVAPGWGTGHIEWLTPADLGPWQHEHDDYIDFTGLAPGTLPAVTLEPAAETESVPSHDDDPGDNVASVTIEITGENRVDFAVSDVTVTGAKGDETRLPVKTSNVGGATYFSHPDDDGPKPYAVVTVPKGLTIVDAPEGCSIGEGDRTGACRLPGVFEAGAETTWSLTVRFDEAVTDAEGTLVLEMRGEDSDFIDHNPANDSAEVLVNPTNGGGSPSGSPGTGGGTAGGDGDGLPVTGTPLGLVILAGVLAAAGGAGLMVLARRRRRHAAVG